MTKTSFTALLTALPTALLAFAAAGCDPGGSPSAASDPSPSASANRQEALAVGQEWVRCLRERGLTRMPDAEISPEGFLNFPPQNGYEWKRDLAKRPDIIEACKPIQDRFPASAQRPRDEYSAEDLRKLKEFASCIRSKGIPEFPDPNSAGEFNLVGTPLENENPNVRFKAAEDACKHIWSGGLKIVDGGGGKSGGKK
jgi:hypothetical protein